MRTSISGSAALLCFMLPLLAGCGDDPPAPRPLAQEIKPTPPAVKPAPAQETKSAAASTSPAEPKADPDKELAARVKQALEQGSRESAPGIDVSAENGVVRLWGTVATAKARRDAERIAAATAGVSKIDNKIVVVRGS